MLPVTTAKAVNSLPDGWRVEKIGLKACDNPVIADSSVDDLVESSSAPLPSDFVELISTVSRKRAIAPEQEISMGLGLLDNEERWEMVRTYAVEGGGDVKVERYHDHRLFSGCFFGRASSYLPDVPIDVAAHSFLFFEERAKWDYQVADFRVLQAPDANNLLHFRMHAVPFSDRDFVVFHALARRVKGHRGFVFMMRQADDGFAPASKKYVRGQIPLNFLRIEEDIDRGGISWRAISTVDPRLPFTPHWFVNLFVPNEINRWIVAFRKHCLGVLKSGLESSGLACAGLFAREAAEKSMALKAVETEYGTEDTDNEQDNTNHKPSKAAEKIMAPKAGTDNDEDNTNNNPVLTPSKEQTITKRLSFNVHDASENAQIEH
jgi:hypothetical protein